MAVKVFARPLPPNASQDQKDRAFKALFASFKRLVNETGVLTEYNRRLSYESQGQKLRRKRHESALRRQREERESREGLQTRLRERFGD